MNSIPTVIGDDTLPPLLVLSPTTCSRIFLWTYKAAMHSVKVVGDNTNNGKSDDKLTTSLIF